MLLELSGHLQNQLFYYNVELDYTISTSTKVGGYEVESLKNDLFRCVTVRGFSHRETEKPSFVVVHKRLHKVLH